MTFLDPNVVREAKQSLMYVGTTMVAQCSNVPDGIENDNDAVLRSN